MSSALVPAPAAAVPDRPTPEGERALRGALGYIARADAAETRRAYAGDWRHFGAWCRQTGLAPLPATPATIAAYLAAHSEMHALATLRRRLAAIARAHREARHAFDSRDPAIRNALRGIAREHARPARQAVALTTAEIRSLVRTCGPDLAGLRDRALLLLGYAGALRRSELVGVDAEHLRFHVEALEVLLPRSKTDPDGEGQRLSIGRGKARETCPVRALEDWLRAAAIRFGPVFRQVTRHGTVEPGRLSAEVLPMGAAWHRECLGRKERLIGPA